MNSILNFWCSEKFLKKFRSRPFFSTIKFFLTDIEDMNWVILDHYFPFFVFLYGFLVLIVHEAPLFQKSLEKLSQTGHLSALMLQIKNRKAFAYTCFYVGGFWSLQNILFSV